MDQNFLNRVGAKRIADRQVNELVGLARGLAADGKIDQQEVEYLQKWLAANVSIRQQPLIGILYRRIEEVLSDGVADEDERAELFETLSAFSDHSTELGEVQKPTTLPLCHPAPSLTFESRRYCFTGTFNYGSRDACESAVVERGATAGSFTQKTNVLVIGSYATDSWKHSSFGNKILTACANRELGLPISIVSEAHWAEHL